MDVNALGVGDVMDRREFIASITALKNSNVMPFGDGLYRFVGSTLAIADLMVDADAAGFVEVAKYADPLSALTGEVGVLHGCRIIEASQATIATLGAATATADLVKGQFAGHQYMGYAWGSLRTLYPFEESGDRMKRFLGAFWKGEDGYGILKESNGLRWEGRSTFAPNP